MAGKHTALRLVETRSLEREKWLCVRKKGIGSSDAASAVGLCPYRSQLELWMEKTGRSVGYQPASQDDPTYWGTQLEPLVASAYAERTGRKVRRLNAVLQHPSLPFMLANIDREVVGCPDVQILECKTAGEFGARLWRDGVPEYVQIQVQHQLAVTGKQAADVAVLLCGQTLEVFRVHRDDDAIARLVVLEARFWEHVENDTPPAADGSESSARALRRLYPGGGDTVDLSADESLGQALEELRGLRDELDAKQASAEALRQRIQQAMGDAARAVLSTGEVSFKRAKDGVSIDTRQLALDHPELVARYTSTRPGARRFLILDKPN